MVGPVHGPGHKVAEPIGPFEECLRQVPSECAEKTLGLLETIIKNTAQSPGEEKYRKIR
jgi:hypothetical protein